MKNYLTKDPNYKRNYRIKNRNIINERKRNYESSKIFRMKYAKENPIKIMCYKAKGRAKLKKMEFNITEEDIVINEICPVFNIPIFAHKAKQRDDSRVLDRIDSTKGYVKGNICMISQRANRIKSNASLEEIEAIASYMRSHLGH